MTCICTRAPRGFAFHNVTIPAWDRPPPTHACSMTCLDIIAARKGESMPADLNKIENEAVASASEAAGEYLEQIGETDLSRLTPEQWQGFIGHVWKCCAGEMQRLFDEGEVPF
ncbi:hypothetical protein [Synechococcus phage Yong-M3-232]|nr:hypothetical protein [Synechococcus phage Yong-M3-232]